MRRTLPGCAAHRVDDGDGSSAVRAFEVRKLDDGHRRVVRTLGGRSVDRDGLDARRVEPVLVRVPHDVLRCAVAYRTRHPLGRLGAGCTSSLFLDALRQRDRHVGTRSKEARDELAPLMPLAWRHGADVHTRQDDVFLFGCGGFRGGRGVAAARAHVEATRASQDDHDKPQQARKVADVSQGGRRLASFR